MKRFFFLLVFVLSGVSESHSQKIPKGYKLVYDQKFNDVKSFDEFEFTEPSKWLLTKEGKKGMSLEFTGKSDYEPPHRSPHTIGLIKNLQVGSFVLEVDLLQTGKEYGHRDMCVIFGLQDSAHFYYTHMASVMDDHAHQIMLVNNAPRVKISTFTTEGVKWVDHQWHKVRVERDISSGVVKVFHDGVLIQETTDMTFGIGAIGFGSFDDSGKIDNIRIWSDTLIRDKRIVFRNEK